MKVMLLNPPVFQYIGYQHRMNPPLGLPILAAVLRNAGHTAEVADLEALGVSPDRLRHVWAAQRESWPDLVGLTCLTSSARGCREAIAAIREAGYDGRIAVGGVHATLFPEEPLSWGADLVVTGECEGNIVQALEAGAKGIVRGVQADLALIPPPAWGFHSPPPAAYQGNAPFIGRPEAIVMMSRGCPHRCIFCGNTIFGGLATRYRPPDAIEAELRGLKDMGIRALFEYSDELVGGPMPAGWMEELADRIGPLGLVWKAQGRCSRKHVDRGLLEAAHRAGARVLMWGVESFSQRVLDASKKGTAVEDIWHTLRLTKEAGIKNWLFTMVGNYREEMSDLAITAQCLREAYLAGLVDYRQTTVVTPMAGTELEAIQKREGWYVAPPEAGPQMNQVYTGTPWLTPKEIEYWLRKFDEACPADWQGRRAAA